MSASSRQALTLQRGRRDFLVRSTCAVLAAGALGIPRASRAAEPVNIGALYPTTGSFAQIGQGCVNAAKLAVQIAIAALDVSQGYAAMCPGGRVKFGPDGKNIYAHPVGVQWQHADLATVFPKEDARASLVKI